MQAHGFVWPAAGVLACWMLTSVVPPVARPCDQAQPQSPAADAGQPQRAAAPAATQAGPLPIPDDLRDAAFDRYVDLYLLGKAWGGVDAALLADCGLQLADGERVLLRPQKALPANRVLAMAVKAAAERHDKATLDRLARAAERDGRKELAGQVAAAMKLAAQARAPEPALEVSVEELTPEAYGRYRRWLLDLEAARLSGDTAALTQLEGRLPKLADLGETRREQMTKLLAETRSAAPLEPDPADAALTRALNRLKAVSRGCNASDGTCD